MNFINNRVEVSIILCCHKIDSYLYKSIDSVLNQTYQNFELIILFDNPQKKQFLELQDNLVDYKNFNKILFFQNDRNYGLTKSLNKAINLSKGKYIMRQDSDDISDKNRLLHLLNHIKQFPKKHLVFSNVIIIDENDNFLKRKLNYILKTNFFLSYNYKNTISHPSILFTRSIYDIIGGYDERFVFSQDYDFIHRIFKDNINHITKVNKYLYSLRYSKSSISSLNGKLQRRNSIVIILINKYKYLKEKFQKFEEVEDFYEYVRKSLKDEFQKAIYYGYNFDEEIPSINFLNIKFIFFLILLYLIHPSLFIGKFKKIFL